MRNIAHAILQVLVFYLIN